MPTKSQREMTFTAHLNLACPSDSKTEAGRLAELRSPYPWSEQPKGGSSHIGGLVHRGGFRESQFGLRFVR